jgi:Tfp pilus assembly protein PilO
VKKQVPGAVVVGGALLIVALVAYMLVVRPKQAQAGDLDGQITQLQSQVEEARHKAAPVRIKVADLFRLSKAMPDREDMPGIVLELNSVASAAGISFEKIEPQPPVPGVSGFWSVPIKVSFQGNYYDLVDFLYRLRTLVSVKEGVLDATGRLFTLDSIGLGQGDNGFPQIRADFTVSAYVFGTQPAPGTAPPPAAETGATSTDTTQTTTEPSSTAPSDSAQQAAGAS